MKIKRYKNRKLYDTEKKRHTSIKELANEIPLVDSLTIIDEFYGDDITSEILCGCIKHLKIDKNILLEHIKLMLEEKYIEQNKTAV